MDPADSLKIFVGGLSQACVFSVFSAICRCYSTSYSLDHACTCTTSWPVSLPISKKLESSGLDSIRF